METSGAAFIPEHARHGIPLDLLFIWASMGTDFPHVPFGGALVSSELTIGRAFLVVALASLFWIAQTSRPRTDRVPERRALS